MKPISQPRNRIHVNGVTALIGPCTIPSPAKGPQTNIHEMPAPRSAVRLHLKAQIN